MCAYNDGHRVWMAVPAPCDNLEMFIGSTDGAPIGTMAACEPKPMPVNDHQLIARQCGRNALAGIGPRWSGVERAMGIENTALIPIIR